jgi:acetate---CoA ligase (ADP-forming)
MITKELLDPESIVIVGASNDTSKPGGKVLFNILKNNFAGKIFGVNPKEREVQGVPCFAKCNLIPEVSLAIIAIPGNLVEGVMEILAYEKKCKAFILFSAGFSETGAEGK